MKTRITILPTLCFVLLASMVFDLGVLAAEERKVLSRNYVGLGVEAYAPLQCYPGENVTVKVRVEALEDLKNVSATLFLWSSKSEGSTPWSTSFTVLDLTDSPNGTVKEETYNVTVPPDLDSGLTYGMLFLDWSIYRPLSWEHQWDKASFRATYVRNRDHENLQDSYIQLENELQNTRIIAYVFLTATIVLVISVWHIQHRRLPKKSAELQRRIH